MSSTVHKVIQWTAHQGGVYALSTGRDDQTVFSAGADKVVAEWSTESSSPLPFSIRTDHSIYALGRTDNRLLIGTSRGSIHVIDLQARQEIRHLKFHDTGVYHLLAAPATPYVFAAAGDGSVTVWDSGQWSLVAHLHLDSGKIRRLVYQADTYRLWAAGSSGNVTAVDVRSWQVVQHWHAHNGGCTAIALALDGTLLTGGKDAYIRRWNPGLEQMLAEEVPAHNFAIYDLVFSADGRFVLSVSRDKTAKLWQSDDLWNPIRIDRKQMGGHLHSVNAALWLPNSHRFVTASDDRSVICWEVR